jgi:hypothetical protein
MPTVAIAPPKTAVLLNPIESIKIPARGETKKVIPMERDPTSAAMEKYNKSSSLVTQSSLTKIWTESKKQRVAMKL